MFRRKTWKSVFPYFQRNNISTVRIGCASGFWGDTATSVPQLVNHGKLDFLIFDYLSEITMSLLTAVKQKSPNLGYAPDFIQAAMTPNLYQIKEKNIRVISNAGGVNPHGCATALKELSKKFDLNLKIAVITGDDLMSQKETIQQLGIKEMNKGLSFPENVKSMNAYLGAGPIAKALDNGADVVITGRCVDSALALGPLISVFQWSMDDWDKLAAGSLVGHLLECGAQSTGGIHTDWHLVPNWQNLGFPVAECENSGKFIITKPDHSGGLVSRGTVAEQLLYEIGDPKFYCLPDVTCDFSNVKLTEIAENTVAVEGARGKKPSRCYKVCATYSDGYRATAVCPVIGPRAVEKAYKTAESIIKRTQMILTYLGLRDFRRTHMEALGSEQCYGRNSNPNAMMSREILMWLAVHHDQKEAVGIFTRELAAAATGGAPGLTTMIGGRPRVSPILRLFSFLYPKEKIKIEMDSDGHVEEYKNPYHDGEDNPHDSNLKYIYLNMENLLPGFNQYRLRELAYTRSGDKGNICNIGVAARHPSFLPYIEKQLTAEAVGLYFQHFLDGDSSSVQRYLLPGIHAFNFVLEDSLGGGGVASLRSDPQGKAFGEMLSDFIIKDMPPLSQLTKE